MSESEVYEVQDTVGFQCSGCGAFQPNRRWMSTSDRNDEWRFAVPAVEHFARHHRCGERLPPRELSPEGQAAKGAWIAHIKEALAENPEATACAGMDIAEATAMVKEYEACSPRN